MFRNHHREVRRIPNTDGQIRKAAEVVAKLKSKGVKAHLVLRTDKGTFPPTAQIEDKRAEGMRWCPYCRTWRYFSVPKFKHNAAISSEEWWTNSYHRQGIKCCQWCGISESEWWVQKVNGSFGENPRRRRRKKRVR